MHITSNRLNVHVCHRTQACWEAIVPLYEYVCFVFCVVLCCVVLCCVVLCCVVLCVYVCCRAGSDA